MKSRLLNLTQFVAQNGVGLDTDGKKRRPGLDRLDPGLDLRRWLSRQ
jgi:hypothetical protein